MRTPILLQLDTPAVALTRWLARVRPRRLAPRLLAAILVASTLLALAATAVQLHGDYRHDMEAVDDELERIERSTLDALGHSVWSYNETQIRLMLAGLLQVRDVQHVEVRAGRDRFSAGRPGAGRVVERAYDLHEPGGSRVLGTLHVQVGLEGMYRRLYERAVIILATESAKAFLIALFILVLVNVHVTRHLARMAAHARRLSLDRLGRQPLRLRRAEQHRDELDQVANALNEMSDALARELERRNAADAERTKLLAERKHDEERIRYLAQNDVLTGLPNRTVFRDRVAQAIAQAQRSGVQVAVMFLDLDHFKNVNDSLGHETGDDLLKATAARLRGCLRAGDTAARQGGDEFVICLPTLPDRRHAIPIAEKLLEALRQPFSIGSNELHVRGSIGISLYPGDATDADGLMRAADAAMYHAKEKGRDTFRFFTAELNHTAQRRLALANRLYEALQRGEFELHYQPKVDLESGRIVGAEALIRWPHADGTSIGPHEFIRVAEETGIIGALGEWILRDACAEAARWHAAGHAGIPVAVNLSPQQLLRPGFPELTERILHETGLPPQALEIEITEGVLMAKSAENMTALEALAALGVGLAIDDFGTGYSSLAYLQRFPVTVLKIDRSFTDGEAEHAGDTAIVTAIIAMAHSLHLDVVAEGVETAEQAHFLKVRGCRAAQGFHFSQAVPPAQFLRLLGAQLDDGRPRLAALAVARR